MSEEIKPLVENEDHTLGEGGEPNTDCKHFVDDGPGVELSKRDPRLGHHTGVIDNVPDRDPGVRQQDLDEVGPGFPVKSGPGYKE